MGGGGGGAGGGEESAEERFGNPYLLRRGPGVSSGPVKGR